MSEKTTWETFFDAHAPVYDENVFTKDVAEGRFDPLTTVESAEIRDLRNVATSATA